MAIILCMITFVRKKQQQEDEVDRINVMREKNVTKWHMKKV